MRLSFATPRTITGQIAALILLSVVTALGLSIGAVLFLLSSAKNRSEAGPPALRFVTIAQLATAAKSDGEVSAIITNAHRIGVDVTLLQREKRAGKTNNAIPVREMTRGAFSRLKLAPGMEAISKDLYLAPDHSLRLPLHNGSALAFPLPDGLGAMFPRFLMGPLLIILTIIAFCVLGVSLYAARFITAPLSSFAAAADAFGRPPSEDEIISERGPQEIVRVARALNDMRARIKALLDERTITLTAISHDLRTPLTRMKLRAERVSKSTSNEALAEGMFADIARMEQMLSETLAYLRDDSLTEMAIVVDLPSILQSICTGLSDLGEPIAYCGPERFAFLCKPSAITRAITNLVENALKYGTQVSVELHFLSETRIQINVADNGPGIPFSQRTRVFEPFFRADTARTSSVNEGFGLGLSIVRNVVEDHCGTVDLLDSDPHGLNVRIILPRYSTAANVKISE